MNSPNKKITNDHFQYTVNQNAHALHKNILHQIKRFFFLSQNKSDNISVPPFDFLIKSDHVTESSLCRASLGQYTLCVYIYIFMDLRLVHSLILAQFLTEDGCVFQLNTHTYAETCADQNIHSPHLLAC